MVSTIFVTMVMITEDRKWKNVSHVGWISGILTLLVLTILCAGYALGLLLFTDSCAVTNYMNKV